MMRQDSRCCGARMTCYRQDKILFCIRCGSIWDQRTGARHFDLSFLDRRSGQNAGKPQRTNTKAAA